jgi:hypothetical protein
MSDQNTESDLFDNLLMDAIMARPNGDILNIMQQAHEVEGSLYDRLQYGYHAVVPEARLEGSDNDMIRLTDDGDIVRDDDADD